TLSTRPSWATFHRTVKVHGRPAHEPASSAIDCTRGLLGRSGFTAFHERSSHKRSDKVCQGTTCLSVRYLTVGAGSRSLAGVRPGGCSVSEHIKHGDSLGG